MSLGVWGECRVVGDWAGHGGGINGDENFDFCSYFKKTKKKFDLDLDLDQISIFSKGKSIVNWSEIMKKRPVT